MTSSSPFSRGRVRRDLVHAMPALGMILGAVAGALAGALHGAGATVAGGGLGIVGGLLVGLAGRWLFGSDS